MVGAISCNALGAGRQILEGDRMKKTLTTLLTAAAIVGTMAATATDASAQRRWWGPAVGLGIVAGIGAAAYLATAPRGYVVYPGYNRPVYRAGCYWASQPMYDRWGRVVGYTGEPVMVCPGY